jgi:protein-disulfide isomerase
MSGGQCAIETPATGTNGAADGKTSDPSTGGPRLLENDHVLGSADAAVIVFQYIDFESDHCGSFARSEFPALKEQYIDTGKIRWVIRHFPLSDNELAEPAARASECAASQNVDAFFDYHDRLFASGADLTDAGLQQHASALGLDRTSFDACLAGETTATRVQQDVVSGQALGVETAPTFFVDDTLVAGFQTAEDLAEQIDRSLAAN